VKLYYIEQVRGTDNERVYRHFELHENYRSLHILLLTVTLLPAGAVGALSVGHPWWALGVGVVLLLPLAAVSILASAHANYHGKCALQIQCGMEPDAT
jgi:hypothetical protein